MRVAITGGIGEGKSTVLGWIREAGWPTYSSDEGAREVLADPRVLAKVTEIAGLVSFSPDGLRRAMLSSAETRRRVNSLLHPLIVERSPRDREGFYEIPLLLETCTQHRYDEVWVVTCGAEEQRRRLLDRYGDPALVDALLSVQLPTKVKVVFADRILRTNLPFENVRSLLGEALENIQRQASGGE
jgi:dephospho-CoA kinase